MRDLGSIIRSVSRRGWLLFLAVILSAGQCAMKLMMPKMMEDIVNNGVMTQSMDYVMGIGRKMLVLCLLLGVCGYLSSILCSVLGHRFARDLRVEVYEHITELGVLQASSLGQGTLITGLTADIDVCATLISAMIPLLIEPVLLTVGGIVMMWRITPVFGGAFLGFVALQIAVMALFIHSTAPGFVRVREAMDAMNTRLQGAFSGFRLIKAFNTRKTEQERFDEKNAALFRSTFDVQRRIVLFNPFVMLIMNGAVASVLWLSGRKVAAGAINIGQVLSAITYSEQVLLSIMASGQLYRRITEAAPSGRRLRSILDVEPNVPEGKERLEVPFRELSFREVSYTYPDGRSVLEKLDFTIRAGETIALIGPTASGKTTVARLCARLFDATAGSIRLNGGDIRSFPAADVRRMVALTEKQSAVLEGTIEENLRFGREAISDEDLRAAIETAQMDTYVSTRDEGLKAPLISMGRSVSGGERQRLIIARALAGRPGLLVLDDTTSALDYATEQTLLTAIRDNYPNMAVLLITNRVASARRADRIMLLDGGRIASEGTDADLLKNSTLYQRICAAQG